MKDSKFSRFMTNNMPVYTWDTVHHMIGLPISEVLFLSYCICKNVTGRGDRLLRYCRFVHNATQVTKPYGSGEHKRCQ